MKRFFRKQAKEAMWRRTRNHVGHKPTRWLKDKIRCRFCDEPMLVRYSHAYPKANAVFGMTSVGNQIGYKCPSCGYISRFNISETEEYIEKLVERRGTVLYYPPVGEWMNHDERVKQQLEALGYFGG